MENGVGDAAVVHQHGDAPADADDERHAQQVRAAGDEGLRQLHLPQPVHKAHHDAAHQKQGGQLREPPAQHRQGQAHLVKGDDAVDHHQKGKGKDDQNGGVPPGQGLDLAHVGVELSGADTHHGAAGVPFHPGGVGGDIPDGDTLKKNKLDDPPEDAVPQGDPGKACGDAGGKGVHGGGDDPGSGSQQDHRHPHHRVIARRQEYRQQQGEEGHGLLPHAVGGAAQAEKYHQNGDQPFLPPVEPADHLADAGVNGAGPDHNAQKASDHQDKHAHVHRVVKAGKRGQQDLPHALRVLRHRVIGPGLGHAVFVIVGAGRDQPRGSRHDHQQQK